MTETWKRPSLYRELSDQREQVVNWRGNPANRDCAVVYDVYYKQALHSEVEFCTVSIGLFEYGEICVLIEVNVFSV